jgi:hypothetical protein
MILIATMFLVMVLSILYCNSKIMSLYANCLVTKEQYSRIMALIFIFIGVGAYSVKFGEIIFLIASSFVSLAMGIIIFVTRKNSPGTGI